MSEIELQQSRALEGMGFTMWLWSKPIRYQIMQAVLLITMIATFVPIVAALACILSGLKRYFAGGTWYVELTPTETIVSLGAAVLFALAAKLYYRYIL